MCPILRRFSCFHSKNILTIKHKTQNSYQFLFQDTVKIGKPIANKDFFLKKKKGK